MGWFGYGAMDGDDGMDLRDTLFYMLGIEYVDGQPIHDENPYNYTDTEITNILEKNQDKIYDWLRDYDWNKRLNPGFIQTVYIQATAQVLLDYGVKISERGKKSIVPFIESDNWALENEERAEEMQKLLKAVKEN